MAKPTKSPATPRVVTGEKSVTAARPDVSRRSAAPTARPGSREPLPGHPHGLPSRPRPLPSPPAAVSGRPQAPPTCPPGRVGRPPWQPPDRPAWNGARAAAEPSVGRRRPLTPRARRMYARRRRAMLLAFVLVIGLLLVIGRLAGRDERRGDTTAPAADTASTAPPSPAASTTPPADDTTTGGARTTTVSRPATGRTGTFDHARGIGPLLGTGGTLHRFRVAVENGQGLVTVDFADAVNRILGDPRGWTAGGRLSLQRVSRGAAAEFTVYLASAATSERMCAAGGLRTARYTSCRLRGAVILNVDRWRTAVPDYGASLETYQAYAVTHEVGHQLGHGHEACPGAGRPAPVMQQQTYGLKGCTANAWPYLDGKRYAGEPVP